MITYSRKVFIPLTRLCRDRCGYCTFATVPGRLDSPYLSPDEVVEIDRIAVDRGIVVRRHVASRDHVLGEDAAAGDRKSVV